MACFHFSVGISTKMELDHSYLSINLPSVIYDGPMQGYNGEFDFKWNTFFLTKPGAAAIDGYLAMLLQPNPHQEIYQPILFTFQV